jgi:hypothetical protein
MEISNATKLMSGILLVTVPAIELGGNFLLRMLRTGEPSYVNNPLRQNLFRAGHAHAGVLVLLSLVCQLLADALILPGFLVWTARLGAPIAAILMPLGFFLSVASPQATRPNGWIWSVYLGAIILGIGLLVLGIGLIRAAGPVA